MNTYAITSTGFRAVSDDMPLLPGETRASTLPPELVASLEDGELRRLRNGLLVLSDWTQMPDAPLPLETKLAYAEYRQRLRDLPEDAQFRAGNWPEAPPT